MGRRRLALHCTRSCNRLMWDGLPPVFCNVTLNFTATCVCCGCILLRPAAMQAALPATQAGCWPSAGQQMMPQPISVL